MNAHPGFAPRSTSSRDVLSVCVQNLGEAEAIDLLLGYLAERRFARVGFLNAHIANLAASDPALKAAFADFLVLADGVGVDIAAKWLHGSSFAANLNGTDFIPALLRASRVPLRVGLIGARGDMADTAARALQAIAPQHDYEVFGDGFFSDQEEPALLERIEAARPDVLLVAMGVPRQELWIARRLDARHCTLPVAVGALFDFLAGAVPRAPLWMRRSRLEWLFRLGLEPGRLWRRYVVGNPLFLARVLRQKWSQARMAA